MKKNKLNINVALVGVAIALSGCGGDGGVKEAQKPYIPEHAINLDILNLNDGGNVDTEKVENTVRLVSVFYDDVINNIFQDLNISGKPSVDSLKNYVSGKYGIDKKTTFRNYKISNNNIYIVMKENAPTGFVNKKVVEDQSDELGDSYLNLGGYLSFNKEESCILFLTEGDEALLCGKRGQDLYIYYRDNINIKSFGLEINTPKFSYPQANVDFDPNSLSVTLDSSKKADLNNDKSLSW